MSWAVVEPGPMTTFTLYHRAETRARSLFILIKDDIQYRFRFIKPVNSVIRSVGSKENGELARFSSKSDSTRSCLTRVTIEKENGEKVDISGWFRFCIGCSWMDVDARWVDIIG